MRISIRRCLSMLRNTSDGNELAVARYQCLEKEHSVGCWYTVGVGHGTAGLLDTVACYMSPVLRDQYNVCMTKVILLLANQNLQVRGKS